MKKFIIFIMPCFLFLAFFMFGCNSNNNTSTGEISNQTYPTSCQFSDYAPVALSLNDKNNSKVVELSVVGSGITVEPIILYDENIISYEPATGRIVAKNVGNTNIVVRYQTSPKEYSQTVLNVLVQNTNYAQSIEVEEDGYLFKLTNPLREAKIIPTAITETNEEYDLGFTFESETPEIFSVDEEGSVLPLAVGVGVLKITAISGYDFECQCYNYISITTQIKVELPIQQFELSVVNSNLEEVSSFNPDDLIYNLYYGKKYNSTINNFYYLKLVCSKPFSECAIRENASLSGQKSLHNILSGGESSSDNKTIYIPFEVFGEGYEEIYYANYDYGYNYYRELKSNSITFTPVPLMSNMSITPVFFAGEENLMINLTQMEKTVGTNNYPLYIFGGAEEDKLYAQSVGYTNYANFKFNNINTKCLNTVTIVHEGIVIPNFDIVEDLFKVEAKNPGVVSVVVRAEDKSNWMQTLNFEVKYFTPTSYAFVQPNDDNTVELIYGMEDYDRINFALQSYTPSYSYIDLSIDITTIYGSSPVRLEGTTVVAQSAGKCFIDVSFAQDTIKIRYEVTIVGKPTKISFTTQKNATISHGSIYQMVFSLQDENGNKITSVDLEVLYYDALGEPTISQEDVQGMWLDFTNYGAIVLMIERGTYHLRIQTVAGDIIGEDLTIICN